MGVGLPPALGDACTFLLLSSSLPQVSLFCFSSHVLLHEGGESHRYPSGWAPGMGQGGPGSGGIPSPQSTAYPHQHCISDTGWMCPVLRALLAAMGDKAAGTGSDPAPLKDVGTDHLEIRYRTVFPGSDVLKPKVVGVLAQSCKKLPSSFGPTSHPSSLCSGCQHAALGVGGGCQKCRQIALDG